MRLGVSKSREMMESKTLQRMVSMELTSLKSPAGSRPVHRIHWPGFEDPYLLMENE